MLSGNKFSSHIGILRVCLKSWLSFEDISVHGDLFEEPAHWFSSFPTAQHFKGEGRVDFPLLSTTCEGGVRLVASIFLLHLDCDFTCGHYCHFADEEMRLREVA